MPRRHSLPGGERLVGGNIDGCLAVDRGEIVLSPRRSLCRFRALCAGEARMSGSLICSYTPASEPYFRTSSSAVFSPTPGTPGMLSRRVAHEGLEVDHVRRVEAVFLAEASRAYSRRSRSGPCGVLTLSTRVVISVTSCKAVLVAGDDRRTPSPAPLADGGSRCRADRPPPSRRARSRADVRCASSTSFKTGICTAELVRHGLARGLVAPRPCSWRNVGSRRSNVTQSASGFSSSSRRCNIVRKP